MAVIRDCMGKSLDHQARIFTNKINIQRNELLYPRLVVTCAASWIISASFAGWLS